MVKSVLDSNCKSFRDTVIRENFELIPETQIQITHSNNRGNCFHQHNEVKVKLQPVFFLYVALIFEHQVKDMYASRKVHVFSSLRRPETLFWHGEGHQRASELTFSINIIQNAIVTV